MNKNPEENRLHDHATPSPLPTRRSVLCGLHSADCPLAGPIHQSTNRSLDQPPWSIPCSSARPSTRSLAESPYSPGQGRTLLAGEPLCRKDTATGPIGESLSCIPYRLLHAGPVRVALRQQLQLQWQSHNIDDASRLVECRSIRNTSRQDSGQARRGWLPTNCSGPRRVSQHSEANPHRQVVSFNGQGRSQCP